MGIEANKENNKNLLHKVNNEGAAIVGVVIIAVISLLLLGVEAKEIAIAVGSGLIGYIRGKANTEQINE